MAKEAKPVIAEAVGTATNVRITAANMEEVMNKAADDCTAKGITDPEEVLKAKLEARAAYKAEMTKVAQAQTAKDKADAEAIAASRL